VTTDQRKSARKIVKVRAVLAMEGQPPILTRTGDVSATGVSLTVPHPLQVGQAGQVAFDLLVDGQSFPVRARVKVMYCIVSHGDFKVGFQFTNLDVNTTAQLSRFMR